jgi:hypothetical protein
LAVVVLAQHGSCIAAAGGFGLFIFGCAAVGAGDAVRIAVRYHLLRWLRVPESEKNIILGQDERGAGEARDTPR